jgi:hypothetical protein
MCLATTKSSESKRLAAMRQLLSVEQALMIAGALVDVVTRHVSDKQALSAIITDLQVLMERERLAEANPLDPPRVLVDPPI